MALYDTILADLASAMKAQEAERLGVLRMVKASLLNAQKETGVDTLSDEDVTAVLMREAKKRKESIESFSAGGRSDLAEKEEAELAILEEYLPEQMSEEDVRAAVKEVIASMDDPQFGAVMGAAMAKLSGQADGAVVKTVVESELG